MNFHELKLVDGVVRMILPGANETLVSSALVVHPIAINFGRHPLVAGLPLRSWFNETKP